MVLVQLFGIRLATQKTRSVELRDSDNGLQEKEDVCDQTKTAMDRGKVWGIMGELVVLDYDEGGQ